MIKANEQSWAMWQDAARVSSTIKNWQGDAKKHAHELFLAGWIGDTNSIADLGCGNGRMADLIKCPVYHGFDASPIMLEYAMTNEAVDGKATLQREVVFYSCNIFDPEGLPCNDWQYDVALLYDVAVHQNEPTAAVLRIMELWKAKRYIFTLLYGDCRQNLLLTIVEPFSEFLRITDTVHISRLHIERHAGCEFATFFVEAIKD